MHIGRRRWIEASGLALVAALVAVTVISTPGAATGPEGTVAPRLPLDDAYIFVRFAQQTARGRVLEWTDGVPSSGATSLAHLALLVPGQMATDLGGWERWSQFVGWLTLLALGLAATRLFRAIGLTGVLPAAGGATVLLAGPVAWGALAGMESALATAAVLLACSLLTELARCRERAGRCRALGTIGLLALLPLVRPEYGLLVVAALPVALLLPAFRGHRRWLPLALLPGALLASLDLWLTGIAKPAGVLAKSITEYAFVDLSTLTDIYLFNLSRKVLPVYLGWRGEVLWRPVGWIVLTVAIAWPIAWLLGRRSRAKRRRPGVPTAGTPTPGAQSLGARNLGTPRLAAPLACWWLFFLTAPLSAMVEWQYMRHHHAALALAWVIAFAAVAIGVERLHRGGARILLLVPLLLLPALSVWRDAYSTGVSELWRRHGPAAEWLAGLERPSLPVVLVNDAGYLAVRYDGPMIDALGLGTPRLALPYRHGSGALIEALARRTHRPEIAALNRDVLDLPELLGRPLGPPPTQPNDTFLAEVRPALLEGTVLDGAGLDFASLADEATAGAALGLEWLPPPSPLEPSRVVIDDQGDRAALQGCRPLRRALALSLSATDGISVRVFAPPAAAAEVVARDGEGVELGRILVPARDSRELRLALTGGVVRLRLERVSAGIPCLESLRLSL